MPGRLLFPEAGLTSPEIALLMAGVDPHTFDTLKAYIPFYPYWLEDKFNAGIEPLIISDGYKHKIHYTSDTLQLDSPIYYPRTPIKAPLFPGYSARPHALVGKDAIAYFCTFPECWNDTTEWERINRSRPLYVYLSTIAAIDLAITQREKAYLFNNAGDELQLVVLDRTYIAEIEAERAARNFITGHYDDITPSISLDPLPVKSAPALNLATAYTLTQAAIDDLEKQRDTLQRSLKQCADALAGAAYSPNNPTTLGLALLAPGALIAFLDDERPYRGYEESDTEIPPQRSTQSYLDALQNEVDSGKIISRKQRIRFGEFLESINDQWRLAL